ncbi:MAG: ABC-F family ATP-binding cassette domain-containing protein, partial [Rhodobacterales bacterium]|nr:ABC-F family ATP-binding cassette domain-containing protein [Rhodobacterales bacterium]
MLHINDLTYRIGGRTLFEGASVVVPMGHKVGLVGANGTGKTTLFRLICGAAAPDSGTIQVRARARVGQVAQEAPAGPESLLDTVLAADTERAALLAEAETATDPERIAHVHTRLADIDAHTAPARAAAILSGLGFDTAAQARPCSDFSGGWRMRVALAAALFARPDLLLLDEPTNHLDLEAALWLEGHLASWPGTLIVISHDRDLLNRAVDGIVHLWGGTLTRYAGGYDRFEATRSAQLVLQEKARRKQEAERQRIQAFVDRFRAKATKARQAQSRMKMLERMQPIAAVIEDRATLFDFPAPDPLPPPLVTLDGVDAGYVPGQPVLRGLDLRIDMDDRIALLGANGNGKSTLIRLLGGRLEPMAGAVRRPGKLRVGYFAQHQTEELDADASPLDHLARRLPDKRESQVRAHLGGFGFGVEKADTRVRDLSGGEKARLLFALMSLDAPHVLLLDEPSNHLDVDARQALVEALNAYQGAVILVSHDPHLIELVADRLWLVA